MSHKLRPLKPFANVARSSGETQLDQTLAPGVSTSSRKGIAFGGGDATSFPDNNSDDEKRYVSSYAALVDKHVLDPKRPLPLKHISIILLVVAIGWIFLQDNANGDLDNFNSLMWAVAKSAVLCGLILLVTAIQAVFKKFSRNVNSE